jgi:NitT/TauT family transport system permease protein
MGPADARAAAGVRTVGDVSLRALSIITIIVVWWVASRAAGNPRLLPGPETVAATAWNAAAHGPLIGDFVITLARVVVAFTLSMFVGTAIGLAAGRSMRADAMLDPLITVTLNLPVLLVIVLAYVWIGLNEAAAIVAVAVAKIPTVAVTLREGARALDPAYADVATIYRLPRWRTFRQILLPQLAPYLAAAGRSGLSITWKIVLIVELLGRPSGVGYALNLAFQNFDVAAILAYGLLFSAVMLALEMLVLQPWERSAVAWRRGA